MSGKFVPEEWISTEPDHVFDPENYEMSPEEYAALDADIAAADEDLRLGRTRPLEEVLAEIREKYPIAG